jgi:hypothetical protein
MDDSGLGVFGESVAEELGENLKISLFGANVRVESQTNEPFLFPDLRQDSDIVFTRHARIRMKSYSSDKARKSASAVTAGRMTWEEYKDKFTNRDIDGLTVKLAIERGLRDQQRDGTWKIRWKNYVIITDSTQKVVVTCFTIDISDHTAMHSTITSDFIAATGSPPTRQSQERESTKKKSERCAENGGPVQYVDQYRLDRSDSDDNDYDGVYQDDKELEH